MKSLEHEIMQKDWTKELKKVIENYVKNRYKVEMNGNNIIIGNQNDFNGFVSITIRYVAPNEENILETSHG